MKGARIDKVRRELLAEILVDLEAASPAVDATIKEHGALEGMPRALGKLQARVEMLAAKLRAVLE